LKGQSIATVLPGITNVANVQLIGKGALTVLVKQANGAPATNATVEIKLGAFPNDTFTGNTGTNGKQKKQEPRKSNRPWLAK
jgi:hypothetical protein